ncbi:hypothetical protein B0J13DRAFT_617521 [Dactylonectria estremocensis]|uniref:Uncharacterized protein n=1 Tax=Dactylonectria estremocensis TaxID=1079267 RepID=A0A9P9FB20_9HYPO|nr:hypothetical protein B0J13DRAFT_617521 [Dactylonectria estremocensis]
MAITTAISDFVNSIYELFISIISTIYTVVNSALSAILGFITGIFTLLGDVTKGMVDVAGGVGKFVAGNAVLITIGALAAFAYVRFTVQGRQLAEGKKTQ